MTAGPLSALHQGGIGLALSKLANKVCRERLVYSPFISILHESRRRGLKLVIDEPKPWFLLFDRYGCVVAERLSLLFG